MWVGPQNGDECQAEFKFIYCGHCHKEVSRTKYYAHKRLYYNRSEKQWSQTKQLNFTDHLTGAAASLPFVESRQVDLYSDQSMTDEGNKIDCVQYVIHIIR